MNNVTLQKVQYSKLSDKKYWNSIYKTNEKEKKPNFFEKKIKTFIKAILGEKLFGFIRENMIHSYADYFLWEVIYKKYLPQTKGLKVLEIGSAPGEHLIRLNQTFGFVPYGIEYSESGVELNKKLFISHNISPDNVIYKDFLSEEFHNQYKGYFDIVISRGFIEHFTDTKDIIEKHIDLLKKKGCLVVSIPNFRGVNYLLLGIFNKRLLPMHNLKIMQRSKFLEMFNRERLSTLFCGYYGTFNFGLFYNKRNFFLSRFALSFCNKLQLILNMIFRILFKEKGAENSFFSPYLIFIGKRKE